MVAYSFKKQFVEPILAGTKCQTIRADRKRHARPGEIVQLYTGMRTRHCKLIAKRECIRVYPITLDFAGKEITIGGGAWRTIPLVHERIRTPAKLDEFARADGFRDFDDMRSFWATNHGVETFKGVIIYWRPE